MFKSSRWRSEKNKIKAVFKLQFHATQVTLIGVDTLSVSVVPSDVGKPTVKLEKATIKDGSCYWDNPVNETVKFVRDPKSGKIHERIYHFVLENGSSKGGVVGDAFIDMSCYALATKSSSVSLPVKGSKSEVILHVSIQRMPNSADERWSEDSENAKQISQDRSLRAKMSNEDMDSHTEIAPIEDAQLSKSSDPRSKMNGNRRVSSGSDISITLSSTDSSLGIDTLQDITTKNEIILEDSKSFFSFKNNGSVQKHSNSDDSAVVLDERQKSWEWLGGLALESSTDDSSGTPREDSAIPDSQESEDTLVEKLQRDVAALSRQAEMSELELQALRKQIVKESRKGQDLSKEITKVKEERDTLLKECEKLKSIPSHVDEETQRNTKESDGCDLQALLEELRQELNHEKDLNKNLQIQLQKTQESNSELLLAVHDLDEMVEQKNKEIADTVEKSANENSVRETDNDHEQLKALEENTGAKDLYVLEQKIRDLQNEIEIYRREKEEIEVQMEQLALDYEISKQENHEISCKLEQCQLQEQLKMQYEFSSSYALNELENQIEILVSELNEKSERFSDSLKTISELESQVKVLKGELEKRIQGHSDSLIAVKELGIQVTSLEDELEKQAQGFEADLEALTRDKVEQEQRAIQAEETLKKMRWQNMSATERLQDEFRRLSVQMTSSFEANESLAAKALTEANELRLQKIILEEKLKKAFESGQLVREQYKLRLRELSSQVVSMTNQLHELQYESDNKSKQIEHEAKLAEETEKSLAQEIVILKKQIETLETEKKALSKQVEEKESLMSELDHKRSLFAELETLYEQCKKEKTELETRIVLVKGRAEESLKELRRMTCLMDEKDAKAKDMQTEIDSLKTQCSLMKQLLSDDEFEKEKLRNQVYQLKIDLKRKEGSLNNSQRKPSDSNVETAIVEVSNLQGKIKLLEAQIEEKESSLENSTRSFLEKENELHRKIKELEQSVEALSQNTTILCEHNSAKATKESEEVKLNADRVSSERDPPTSTMRIGETSEKKESKPFARNKAGQLNELLGEMALMEQRNEEMECELKEMQERYSEISLKFAEVEGERQQLVMKLRNLKNANKKNTAVLA